MLSVNDKRIFSIHSKTDLKHTSSIIQELKDYLPSVSFRSSTNENMQTDLEHSFIVICFLSENLISSQFCLEMLNQATNLNKQIVLISWDEKIAIKRIPKGIRKKIHSSCYNWNVIQEKEDIVRAMISWLGLEPPINKATGCKITFNVKAISGFVYRIDDFVGSNPTDKTITIRVWPGSHTYKFACKSLSQCCIDGSFDSTEKDLFIEIDLEQELQQNGYNGRLLYQNGDVYEGDIKDKMPNGKGIYTRSTKDSYTGSFINGNISEGFYENAKGEKITGTFSNWLAVGDCQYTTADRHTFKGFFENGYISEGIHTYPDGSIYKGKFSNWRRHGKGIMTLSNGDSIEGEWINDIPEGRCTYRWSYGAYFEGLFFSGVPHGTIQIFDKSGNLLKEGLIRDLTEMQIQECGR